MGPNLVGFKPSDVTFLSWLIFGHPMAEQLIINIVTILKENGDEWRGLSWEDYLRLSKDSEKYFHQFWLNEMVRNQVLEYDEIARQYVLGMYAFECLRPYISYN